MIAEAASGGEGEVGRNGHLLILLFHCRLVNWIGRIGFWRANFSRFAVHEVQPHFFVSVFTSLFSLRFCLALPAWACCGLPRIASSSLTAGQSQYIFLVIVPNLNKLKLKFKLKSVCCTQSTVRGPQSTFYTDRYVM